jgi:hypothetical protein
MERIIQFRWTTAANKQAMISKPFKTKHSTAIIALLQTQRALKGLGLPQARNAGDVSPPGRTRCVVDSRGSASPMSACQLPPGNYVFTLWLSVLCMRSKAWLAAPVLLAHAEVTKNIIFFQWVQN